MSRRILIPLDGSEDEEAALCYVEGLVSRLSPEKKVEVTLFPCIYSTKTRFLPLHRFTVASTVGGQNVKEFTVQN